MRHDLIWCAARVKIEFVGKSTFKYCLLQYVMFYSDLCQKLCDVLHSIKENGMTEWMGFVIATRIWGSITFYGMISFFFTCYCKFFKRNIVDYCDKGLYET